MRNSAESASVAPDGTWNAVVAGAGPAGTVAAHIMAREGWSVLIVDSPRVGGFRIGEALPAAASRLLRKIGFAPPNTDGGHARIGGNLWSWGSGDLEASDCFCDPEGPGWRLDRLRFDKQLCRQAAQSGASFKRARVVGLSRRDDHWRIEFDDATFATARWLIDATGRSAALAQKVGAQRHRDGRLLAIYVRGEPDAGFQFDRTIVESAPNGWWYAARLPSGAPVAGIHLDPRDAVPMMAIPGAWRHALERTRHLAPLLRNAKFGKPMPAQEACGACLDHVFGNGWVACGDAAVSFDPISSQGIFSALHGGMSAARALLAHENGERLALVRYAARINTIREVYLARWRALYRDEVRWLDEHFWIEARLAGAQSAVRAVEGPLWA